MSENLYVNELIEWKCDDGKKVERILWIADEGYDLFTIEVNSEKSLPILRRANEVITAIEGNMATKLTSDPYMKFIREEDIKPKSKELRDKGWKVIEAMVQANNEPDIYNKHKRGELVRKAIEEHGVTYRIIYKYLRKYWQRGKNKNSLLPDYENSGAKGKEKIPGNKKLGRPRKYGVGINVDEETKRIFRIAINRYYNTNKRNTLTTAFNLMVKEFYTENYNIIDGIKYPILIDENEIPSIDQFKYWFDKEQNIKKSITSRKGAKRFELEHRAVLGRSDTYVLGPGSLYQIDATIGNVYLVSRYNRKWIIGKPVIYAIIDVFSRMIAGIYVGLEGPSWTGAMMALANATMNKVSYCKEYGINIDEEDWPCSHLPETIIADNGEMASSSVEPFINALQVRIDNTASYRADWKGIVEQHFNTTQGKVKPFLPGTIDTDYRQRGDPDYRIQAKLDLYQFTQVIIGCALKHNKEKLLDYYDRNVAMIEQDVIPIPLELWNWGIKNRSGKLRVFPEDIIKLNLMPVDQVLVTENGLKFKNMFYGCETALKEMWFEKARNKGTWKKEISYDPRNMNNIYLRAEDGRSFEKCSLLESQRKYFNKTYDEIVYLDEYENLERKKYRVKKLQSEVDLATFIENIVKTADDMTNKVVDKHVSKASKLKSIKENRKYEKEANRESEAFILGSNDNKKDGRVIEAENYFKDNEEEVDEDIALLERIQKERLNEKSKK